VDLYLKDLAVASDGGENQLGVNLASRADLHKLVLIGHSQDGKGEKLGQYAAGRGWFAIIRFYGPLEPFVDQTWNPDDIVKSEAT